MKNYRTTICGALLAAVSSIALYQNNGGNLSDWKMWIIPALIGGLSYLAKDAGVSGTSKALIGCLALLTLPSCAWLQSPQGKQVVVSLEKLGVAALVARGKISPGDGIAIDKGTAILTSAKSGSSKALDLADVGLDVARSKGLVKDGDVVLIKDAATAIINPDASSLSAVSDVTSGK